MYVTNKEDELSRVRN